MAKKQMLFKTKGMNRDLSVSSFNPEFAFENMNLRLSTNDGNTLLSWVNEKGTKDIYTFKWGMNHRKVTFELSGNAIGTAVVNHKLVVFTTESIGETTGDDHIYVLKYSDKEKEDMLVEDHYEGKLNFSTNNPLETLVSVEADHIEKVYWVDGKNQPRLINIKDFKDINAKKPSSGVDTQFDFVPTFDTSNATVTANTGSSGTFEPGVIQYCYTYYNKYGQQTNIVWLSPLYYLAHSDRGASPEEKVTSSFRIEIKSADIHFDYVRLYSIHRTSLNAEPIVKLLDDLPIVTTVVTGGNTSGTTAAEDIVYTDSGITGAIMDPYELLYVGGKEIIAQTFADKDDTLFVGNFEEKGGLLKTYTLPTSITFERRTVEGLVPKASGVYSYKNQLDKPQDAITTFKGGERYRFGFQLQKKTGEWSEPVFIKDETNTLYPSVSEGNVNLVQAKATISSFSSITDNISDYMNIRPLIVYPTISDRTVLCQGVLNPTVFNVKDRPDNSPYAQASWYFRPIENNMNYDSDSVYQPPVGPLAENFYKDITIDDTDKPLNDQGGNTPGGGGGGSDPVDPSEIPTDNPTTDDPPSENPGDPDPTNPETAGARGMGNDTEDSDSTTTDTTTDTPGSTPTDPGNTPSGDTPTEEYDRFTSILIARVDEKEIATILSRRELTYVRRNRNLSDTEEIRETVFPFWGAIRLSMKKELSNEWTGKPLFAFLSGDNASWPVPREDMMGTIGDSLQYLHLEEVRVIEESYGIENLTVSRSGLLCYEDGVTGQLNEYTFTFDDHINKYTVVFKKVDRFSDVTTDPNAAPKKGSKLEYRHNYTLFTEDMAYDIAANRREGDSEKGVYLDKAEQILSRVEIQGSVRKYKTVWNDNNNQMPTVVDSNTQFFVDQSIVTLNSPDIEFDTEVQTYGTDNLQLKIVGKIPITSGGANFDITTSSAMLEVAHQYDLDVIEGNANTYNRWHELNPNPVFGSGVRTYRVLYDGTGQNTQYRHLVSAFLWNDAYVVANPKKEDGITTDYLTHDFMVFPWQRTGSINNDFRNADVASSKLRIKKESNLLFSSNTEYNSTDSSNDNNSNNESPITHSCQIHLTENDFIENLRIDGYNYYPNVDKVLYTSGGYNVHSNRYIKSNVLPAKAVKVNSPIAMKYKSTSHAVINYREPIIPTSSESTNTESNSSNASSNAYPYLLLGELIKNPDDNSRFGGNTQSAVRSNKWQVAGPTVAIGNKNNGDTELTWNQGDTYYQRYDCLKTYAFTPEDTNQIVEILSFMCETHVNIDGRYDKNRGMIDNTDMSPVNFNKLNPVYSQQNNFFTYRQLDHEEEERLRYPNQMWYSKTKTPGADVDLWTILSEAHTLALDGDKGELNALRRFNNQLLAFQDTGLSQVLYNENTVLSTQQGVPVEIANSNKVSGKNYISNTVGCSNKWSIVNTPNGLYFMDSNDKGIYVFTGQLQNLSVQKGFNSWCKQMIPSGEVKWEPVNFGGEVITTNPGESTESTEVKNSTFTGFYDRQNQDVLWVNNDTAVAYSERVGAFTSFYDYGGTPWFENLDDTGIWVKNNSGAELWKHQAGDYCRFFGENKPYWMTLVGNPEPLTDKIFTNLEFRACVSEDGTVVPANTAGNAIERFNPLLPFDSLETWNEYQHGIANLQWKNQHGPMLHHLRDEGQTAHLNRKFRIWRCDIPRDNAQVVLPQNPTPEEQKAYDDFIADERVKGIYRMKAHPIDRMRNPWLYLKLLKNAEKDAHEGQETIEKSLNKAEVHDVVMTFYN